MPGAACRAQRCRAQRCRAQRCRAERCRAEPAASSSASTPGAAITAALQEDAERYDWVAAAVGANSAAGYQLAAGTSVLAIGGFNGSDPSPTLAEFKDLVAAGRIHYFIAGGTGGRGGPGGIGGPGGGASGTSSAITSWVEETFTATTLDGVTCTTSRPARSDRLRARCGR